MLSMTGYGSGEYRSREYIITVEIKSYNNRYLDISHTIAPALSSYEEYIDGEIKKVCRRGHLDVSVFLRTLISHESLSVDRNLVLEYKRCFEEIESLTEGKEPTVFNYASLEGVITPSTTTDASVYGEGVESALSEALSKLRAGKEREGEGTRKDLEKLGDKFEENLSLVLSKRAEMEEYFKGVLLEKYEELLGEKGKDDPRFLSEVAALLVKYSINEECSRLKVHMERYRELLSSTEPVGKELDFLCQEMNREINTTASKSQMVEINLAVVKMKDALEDIREQVRNIE